MKALILDAGRPATCEPLTCTMPLAKCPVANMPLAAAQRRELEAAGLSGELPAPGETAVYLRGDGWCSSAMLRLLLENVPRVLRTSAGEPVAWSGDGPVVPDHADTVTVSADCLLIRYPWDLLRVHEMLVARITEDSIRGILSSAAHVCGRLVLGEGSEILPGVFIEGTVVVGRKTRIGPNAYLRGFTAIGDECRIGQAVEIKNSIVMRGTHIAHLSYCGDCIIGEGVNLGAGTIIANVRHDGQNHRSRVGADLVDTGRRKFGAVLGAGVHTGIHTSIYPGRKLWPNTTTRPGEVVTDDLRAADGSGEI